MNISSLFKLCVIVGWIIGVNGASLWADEGRYRIAGVPPGETLNIRTGPGTNFPVAAELPNGKEGIAITGDAVMNGSAEWVPITYPGGKGWVRTKYLARSSSVSSSSSGPGSISGASEPGRTIVKSALHNLTLSVKIPSDMNKMDVMSEGEDDLKDLVFASLKSGSKSHVTMERLSAFSASQKLSAPELEKHECLTWETSAAKLGSMRKFNGTFLDKPAFAVLVNYEAGFPESSHMMFSVITLEPVNGHFYKLGYSLQKEDEGYDLSPQELINSVWLVAESGGSTSTSTEGKQPLGEFAGTIQASYPGRKPVPIPRKVIFRLDGLPLMKSKDSADGVNYAESWVLLRGSWVGNQYQSTSQMVLSTEIPNEAWVDEDIVITALSGDRLKLESSWPSQGKKVQLIGILEKQ